MLNLLIKAFLIQINPYSIQRELKMIDLTIYSGKELDKFMEKITLYSLMTKVKLHHQILGKELWEIVTFYQLSRLSLNGHNV